MRTSKISLLLPTRQRPDSLYRFYDSFVQTADEPDSVEVVVYIDEDDGSYDDVLLPNLKKVRGPRIVLSQMWNMCWHNSTGDILAHMGDDIVFRTKHWDTAVREAFDRYPDQIAFVFGNDGSPGGIDKTFGTHGFISHMWADILGRFVPPYFSSDYNDTWLNDVAKALNRHVYIDIYTEHMHHTLGKAEIDQNTRDRLQRHAADRVEDLYASLQDEREKDIEKLRNFIDEFAK